MIKHNHVIYQSPGKLRTKIIVSYTRGNWKMLDYFYKLIPKNVEEKIYSAAGFFYSRAIGVAKIFKRK
jgi:hypothetical protein